MSLFSASSMWVLEIGEKKKKTTYDFMVLTVSKACSWFASALGPPMCLINFGSFK